MKRRPKAKTWGVTTIRFWYPPPPRSPTAVSIGPSYEISTRKQALAEARALAEVTVPTSSPEAATVRPITQGRKVIGYDVLGAGERRHASVVHEYDTPPFAGPRVGIWILKPV